MEARSTRTLLVTIVLVLITGSCNEVTAQEPRVTVQPHILPVKFTWKSERGWSVDFTTPDLVTPVAKISASMRLSDVSDDYDSNILVIVLEDNTHIYDLGEEQYVLELPQNLEGHIELQYRRGDIFVQVPNPKTTERPSRSSNESYTYLQPRKTTSFWHPDWLEELNGHPIIPGAEMAGIKLGYTEELVIERLGEPDSGPELTTTNRELERYVLYYYYDYPDIQLIIFTDPQTRRVRQLRVYGLNFNSRGLIPGTPESITIGSSEGKVRRQLEV